MSVTSKLPHVIISFQSLVEMLEGEVWTHQIYIFQYLFVDMNVDIQIIKYQLLIRLTSYFCEGEEKKTSLETGAGLAWRRVAARSRRCAGAFISGATRAGQRGHSAININR